MLDNDKSWSEWGVQGSWGKVNSEPADMPFANELGKDGWKLFQVSQWGSSSGYYFRREK